MKYAAEARSIDAENVGEVREWSFNCPTRSSRVSRGRRASEAVEPMSAKDSYALRC